MAVQLVSFLLPPRLQPTSPYPISTQAGGCLSRGGHSQAGVLALTLDHASSLRRGLTLHFLLFTPVHRVDV